MKQLYEDFVDYWAIPLSVGAVIIAMILSYFVKENKNE
jgi:hypothetical protein